MNFRDSLSSLTCSITYDENHINHHRNVDDCTEVYTIDIPGVSADKVIISKRWDNRYKKLYLDVVIDEGNDEFRKEVISIDYDIFNRYSTVIENGRITITLYEFINVEPIFDLI